jgi:hypothetical protein
MLGRLPFDLQAVCRAVSTLKICPASQAIEVYIYLKPSCSPTFQLRLTFTAVSTEANDLLLSYIQHFRVRVSRPACFRGRVSLLL